MVEGCDLKTISMVTKVDLTIRTDTGMVNTSPISAIQPVVRVKQGCSFSIHIQVKDDDGDIFNCRWANNKTADECGGICNGLSGSILNVETCILSYNATGSTGWYAVALQIEDFVSQSDIDPLSSVSLQFFIFVYSSTETCDNRPSINTSTDQNGALIFILSNTTYHKTIIASTHSINSKISEINTVSPIGMTKSALLKYGIVESQWYINVTWTPKETHIGSHQFCYAAFDTNRQVSDQICITLKSSNLIKENNTATEVSKILEDLNIITWNNITSGDLVTSSNILKDIADFVAENTDALTKNQIEDSSSITGIVKAVTDYSKSFTNVLHSEASIIIQKENICLPITGYSSTFYRNISKLFPESLSLNNSNISDVNSIIADFSIEPTPARIYYPVVIKFQYLSEDYSNPICVFLNFNMPGHPNGAWSTVGSRVVESTDTYTICEYTHTTNFAILMSPGKTVVCTAIAVALHYMFLVDFALMLGEGIQVAIMVVIIFRRESILQWMLPLCYGNCWLTVESKLIWAFVAPALFVVMVKQGYEHFQRRRTAIRLMESKSLSSSVSEFLTFHNINPVTDYMEI
ncbi:unnamed protein product [Mytilus coruscus]|uniref:GAIN-B domain-containing protein n=1 Tax=Mytilus coruscus TaxID=42192 RepID=A0A6J8B8W7_MYTCO|nr:unnamed protein product [Mytilus coruscus]